MMELRQQQGIAALALEFAILTAARSGEVRGMTWGEILGAVWVVPASRMKAVREHRVPLCARAQEVLDIMRKHGESGLVFGSTMRQDKPLSDMTLAAVLKRMGRTDLTVHGFRSTFRDWAAERTAYPREVAEQALAHTLRDKVEAAYRRGDLFDKRARLMGDWAAYCASPATRGDVLPIGRQA